jgi:hypothetical protein
MDFQAQLREIADDYDKINSLSPDEVLQLSRSLNPYAYNPAQGQYTERKRYAICSYTNFLGEYMRKFSMTSLVAFVFRMLQEWDVPADVRRWVPKKVAEESAVDAKALDLDELVERLEVLLEMAKQTRKEKEGNEGELAGAALGLSMYAHMLSEDIKRKMPKTLEQARMTPEVKAEFDKFPEAVKKRYTSIESAIEVPAKVAKGIIEHFLKEYLEYDPLANVKSAAAESDAPRILPPSEQEKADKLAADQKDQVTVDGYTLAKFKEIRAAHALASEEATAGKEHVGTVFATPLNYNAASAVLNNEALLDAVVYFASEPEQWEKVRCYLDPAVEKVLDLVPPQDTLHRWGYFTEVNYEDLRKATELVYNDRPYLEWAMGLWDVIEGTPEECKAKYEAYKDRHAEELPMDIKMVEFGGWTPFADLRANREKIEFYNKNTGIIQKILDRHAEDAKMGKDMVKNRVKVSKAKNIREQGPDHPDLKNYTESAGPNMQAMGAVKGLDKEQMKRLAAAQGDLKAAQDLEYIDNIKARLDEFEAALTTRELTTTERRDYDFFKKQYVEALKVLEIPENAIQVDMLVNDGSELKRTTFYTKSDEALDEEHKEELSQLPGGVVEAAMLDQLTKYNYSAVRAGQTPRPDSSVTVLPSGAQVMGDPARLSSLMQLMAEQEAKDSLTPAPGLVDGDGNDVAQLAPFAQAIFEKVKPEDYSKATVVETYEMVDGELRPVLKVEGVELIEEAEH